MQRHDSRVYKQVRQQTDNKKKMSVSFFLCILLLQHKRKPSGAGVVSDKLYTIRTPQNLDSGKRRQRDAAIPQLDCKESSCLEATWSQDTYGHFQRHPLPSEMKRDKHMYYPMGYYFSLAARLRTGSV